MVNHVVYGVYHIVCLYCLIFCRWGAKPFVSFKKVLANMGGAVASQLELISFHSVSKGFVGEYVLLVYKFICIFLTACSKYYVFWVVLGFHHLGFGSFYICNAKVWSSWGFHGTGKY